MTNEATKWTTKDFEWYWAERFAGVGSPDHFDRTHWWIGKSDNGDALVEGPLLNGSREVIQCMTGLNPPLTFPEQMEYQSRAGAVEFPRILGVASWYELLRRHPKLGRLRVSGVQSTGPGMLLSTLLKWGLKPWPLLRPVERRVFQIALEKAKFEKGPDRRPAFTDLKEKIERESLLHMSLLAVCRPKDPVKRRLIESTFILPSGSYSDWLNPVWPKPGALEKHRLRLRYLLGRQALQALDKGDLVVAVRGDASNPKQLALELTDLLAKNRAGSPTPAGRDRTDDWLENISEFEIEECRRLKTAKSGKSQGKQGNQITRRGFQKLFAGIDL